MTETIPKHGVLALALGLACSAWWPTHAEAAAKTAPAEQVPLIAPKFKRPEPVEPPQAPKPPTKPAPTPAPVPTAAPRVEVLPLPTPASQPVAVRVTSTSQPASAPASAPASSPAMTPAVAPAIAAVPPPHSPASSPASAPLDKASVPPLFAVKRPPPLSDYYFHIGVKAMGVYAFGVLQYGPLGAVEIGVRLPFWRQRLGLLVEPAVGMLWGPGSTQPSALWIGGPIAVAFQQPVGGSLFRAIAGPTVDWGKSSRTAPGGRYDDQFLTVGATVGVGYLWQVGQGGIVIDLRYRSFAYTMAAEHLTSHGATLSLGYAAFL